MMNFTEQYRQQFLTEEYYVNALNHYNESINLFIESDAFEDDEYNCGEASRWSLITATDLDILYLKYTAGQAIEEMIPLFEKVIEGYEKQAEALAIFHKSEKPSVIATQSATLNILGLAFLLNRNDLFARIHQLVNGEGERHSGEDEIINKFFKLNDPKHLTINEGKLFSLPYSSLCDVIDNVLIKNNKERALEHLDAYLSDWYQMNKHETWYNSHLDLENSSAYSGYWAFEAAALVYLLDLDDSVLHKYLFYPKDIVQWARSQKPSYEPNLDTQQYSIAAGEICPRSGYWFTVAKENSRQYFNEGDVFPDFKNSWGMVYWQFSGEE
ncbi:DUF1911 domain-containing protein [Acinetobacter rongchengensis]|uniref:DUF1911 domain-containing protein n=2 Tax=Acinetobacter rongchengensis TaxID=2419601 RepID=A0A3A8EMW4_9GAMM|nr:DUF1911 domain-containing protein [Acinetobacter rongchengensis]